MTEPRAQRPHMPGYGVETSLAGLLPWTWAQQRLQASHDYWVSTAWPDGRPHTTPVWACWDGAALWFSAAPGSRKVRNIRTSPPVTVATDDPRNPVVLDGDAQLVTEPDATSTFAAALNTKYDTEYPMSFFTENALVVVRPRSAFGLADGAFASSPTRWWFGAGS